MRNNCIWSRCFLVALMVTAFLTVPAQAHAETKIVVVNIQKIMGDSKAAKSIQDQLEKQRKLYQEEFSKHERSFVDEAKALSDSREDMEPEAFAKKKQEFDNKLLEMQKLAKKRQRALEEAAGVGLGVLRDEVIKIVTEMSDKEKFDLVLTQQNIIWGRQDLEITDAVMTRLDKSLKEVKLNIKTN